MNLGSVLLGSFSILATALPRKDVRKSADKERKKNKRANMKNTVNTFLKVHILMFPFR